MTFIILKDTFGNGLTTFDSVGLEVYDKDELEEVVAAAAQELLDEDGYEDMEEYDGNRITISNTIVICEIVEKVGRMSVENYIKEVVKQKEDTVRKERFKLYLKLKEEFRDL
jgi:phosphoribosylpyrophosphate synthetase